MASRNNNAQSLVQNADPDLLDAACRDKPAVDSLTPYLLSKLMEKFPAVGMKMKVDKKLLIWKESNVTAINKVQLVRYLEDLRWKSHTAALLERVLYERPKDVPTYLITLLAKGDVAAAGPPLPSEDAAATKVQAMQRGRKGRKAAKGKKASFEAPVVVPEAADASEQEAHRLAMEKEAKEEAAAAAVMDDDKAATKMQAIQRGRNARKSR